MKKGPAVSGGRRGATRDRSPGLLLIPVSSFLGEPAGSTRAIDLTDIWVPIEEGPRQSSPGTGALRLTRTNRGIYLTGRVHTSIAETCSRCLRDIDLPVEIEIEEEYLPTLDVTTGARLDRDMEPDVARLTDGHQLDIGALLADELSLIEPIAPLCRADCPGLCPTCGLDLSESAHDHGDAPLDPRLAALAGLRVDEEAENG